MKSKMTRITIAVLGIFFLFITGCNGNNDSTGGDSDEDQIIVDGDKEDELPDGDNSTDGDTTDSDMVEGDITDGDTTDSDMVEGDITDGDTTDSDVVEGDITDGDTTDSDVVEGDITDGDTTEDDTVDGDIDSDTEDETVDELACANGTCIDSATGLEWQQGDGGEKFWAYAEDYCEALSLNGKDDWRLPSVSEFRSLVRGCPATATGGSCGVTDGCSTYDCSDTSCSGCASSVGPDGGCYRAEPLGGSCGWYWSSVWMEANVWIIDFATASIFPNHTAQPLYTRCVRVADVLDGDVDEEISDGDLIDGDIEDDTEAEEESPTETTFTDDTTGLEWQVWDGGEMDQDAAIAYCQSLTYAGYEDWRLPSIMELRSLIRGCELTQTDGTCSVADDCLSLDSCREEFPCNGCASGSGPSDGCYWPQETGGICYLYWSSSVVTEMSGYGWHINFDQGGINAFDDSLEYRARCVRGATCNDGGCL